MCLGFWVKTTELTNSYFGNRSKRTVFQIDLKRFDTFSQKDRGQDILIFIFEDTR
jgi:hypothetical protein